MVYWLNTSIPKLAVFPQRTITELQIWLKNNEAALNKLSIIGYFPEATNTAQNTAQELLDLVKSNDLWAQVPVTIFGSISPTPSIPNVIKDYSHLIDFCVPKNNDGLVIDKKSFFDMMACPAKVVDNTRRPKLNTLRISVVKIKAEEEDKNKRVHCIFGFMHDVNSPFIEHLKQTTKRKSANSMYTEKDDNTKEYFFYNTPPLPFKIEVWDRLKLGKAPLGVVMFNTIHELFAKGANHAFEFTQTRQQKHKPLGRIRILWSMT